MARHNFPGGVAFQGEDVGVLVGYFALIIVVGVWSSRRNKNDSVRNYFLAGRDINWVLVGCGLFATDISSTHFIGMTGSASKSGIAIAGFELNAMFVLLLLGWIFIPVYLASGVYTLPEFLNRRFGSLRIQTYLSGLSLLLSLLIRISAGLYAGAVFIQETLQWNLYYSSLALLAIAGIYTVFGGLTAVMWTDLMQTIFILSGATAVSVLSFQEVGGYQALVRDFPQATDHNSSKFNSSCGKVPDDYMQLLRSVEDPEYPWTGMIFGLTISSIWYWCSDQVMVQRCLSAKSFSNAKGGCILAAYLKALPLFLFVFPGMAARILFPEDIACSSPEKCRAICGSLYGCGDISYPLLVLRLMPTGARGFMLAVILASIMASLSGVFNSCATLFTMDIWPRFRRKPSEVELLIVGRLFITTLAVLSIFWVPVIKASQGSQLFNYTQSITSYLSPPVCAVFLTAIFCPRINEKGAFWGLMLGLGAGLSRFVLDIVFAPSPCYPDGANYHVNYVPAIVGDVHYLHFGCILFLLVCIFTLVVSYLSTPIDQKHLYRLTFWTRHSREERTDLDFPKAHPPSDNFTLEPYLPTERIGPRRFFPKNSIDLPSEIPASQSETTSCWTFWTRACCMGVARGDTVRDQGVQRPSPAQDVLDAEERLREGWRWRWFLNVNALVMISVSIALWVFFK